MSYIEGWSVLSTNKMRDVCPLPHSCHPEYIFYSHMSSVIGAWGGGAYDTRRDRLYIWGGGHGDYSGNELYSLDIRTGLWSRLTNPSCPNLPGDPLWINPPDGGVLALADPYGPNSRHTYSELAFVQHLDKFWIYGGSLASGSGGMAQDIWLFDPVTNTWATVGVLPGVPSSGYYMPICDYDPITRRVYAKNSNQFHYYNPDTAVWTKLVNYATPSISGMGNGDIGGCIDPIRRKFFCIGPSGTYCTLMDPPYTTTLLTTTGDWPKHAGGLAYHPGTGFLVGWDGSNESVGVGDYVNIHLFNPDTNIWTTIVTTGYPTKFTKTGGTTTHGTYNRWRFSPLLNGFVVVNSVDDYAYLYQLPKSTAWIPLTDMKWNLKRPGTSLGISCPGSSGKHIRATFNPVNSLAYIGTGDYSMSTDPWVESGHNNLFTYQVRTNTWTQIQAYCRPDGLVMPAGPDQVGWTYDTRRNLVRLFSGFIWGPGDNSTRGLCPNSTKDPKIWEFNPFTSTWNVPTVNQYAFAAVVNGQTGNYDPVTDTFIRFFDEGYPVSRYRLNLATGIEDRRRWTALELGVPQRLQPNNTICAHDIKRGCLFFPGYDYGLWKYTIATDILTRVCALPPSIPLMTEELYCAWDSVNDLFLFSWYEKISDHYFRITLHIYHPYVETPYWEVIAPTETDPAGNSISSRMCWFDPFQNCLAAWGTDGDNGNPTILLFRYGEGGGLPPVPPVPPDFPDAPTNLRIVV